MKKIRLSALVLVAVMAFLLTSCEKDNVLDVEIEKPVIKITYGEPEFSIVSTTATGYENGNMKVPVMGEISQFIIIAKKAIYRDGVLLDQSKQGKVADITVEHNKDWVVVEKSAVNDTTMQIKLTAFENSFDKDRECAVTLQLEGQKFIINLAQDKAVIEYSTPLFQNDCKGGELLFSRSGDTTHKLRFRTIARKIINGKETEEYSTFNVDGWSWEIDRTDIFHITNIGDEVPGIKVLTLKAQKNDTGLSIDGTLTLKYARDGVTGAIKVPMNSYKGFIIDVEDGREPEFH